MMVVQPDSERQLDDVILDVFEQSVTSCATDRHQFYFPVTSQSDARAFVCELHTRGVQYSRLSATVGEREHSFTAWRTGNSHPGIGNRVVERINRPVQQLLLADDDSDVDIGLSDVDDDDDDDDDDGDVIKQFKSSLPPTRLKQFNKTTSGASPRVNGANKNVSKQITDDQKCVDTATETIAVTHDNKGVGVVTDTANHAHSSQPAVNCHTEHVRRVEQSTSDAVCLENEQNNNKTSLDAGESREHDKLSDERDDAGDEEVNELELQLSRDEVDGKEEMGRTEELEKDGASGGGSGSGSVEMVSAERRDSWVTELSINLSTDEHTTGQQRQITVTSAAAAAGGGEGGGVDQLSSLIATTADTTNTTTTTTTTSITTTTTTNTNTENSDFNVSSNVLLPTAVDTDIPEVNSNMTSQLEPQTNDIIPICTAVSNSPSNDCTEPLSHPTATDSFPPEVNGHVTSQPEIRTTTAAAIVVDDSAKPEVIAAVEQATGSDDVTSTGNSVIMTSSASPELTSSAAEVTSETERKCTMRNKPRKTDDNVDVVDENYNSEDDEVDGDDNDDDDDKEMTSGSRYVEGRGRSWKQGGKRWGRRYQHDGPGYVYVFTDSSVECLEQCRVKISASRRPHARLRQAQLFNVNMRLVTAVRVTSRLAAACLLRQRLRDSAIPATVDWFNTSLDVALSSVMDVATTYAPTPSVDNVEH